MGRPGTVCVCGGLTYQLLASEVTPINKGEPLKVIGSAVRRW